MGLTPATSILIQELIPGAHLVQTPTSFILVGMPPEVVKSLKEKSIGTPTIWLLPDQYLIGGVSRLSVEFPFYYSVFFSGLLERASKIKLIGTAKQIEDCMNILRLGLLGLTPEEFMESGTPPEVWNSIYREVQWLALKEKDGSVKSIESFFECHPFEENKVEIDGVQIEKLGADHHKFTYQEEETVLHYEANEKILPGYFKSLPSNVNLMPSPRFGVHFLGSATGFSNAPSSGLIIQHGARMILIDPIPYVSELLELRGLHRNQVSAILITHNHDDHAGGLTEFLIADKKMTLITTLEIHHMMMKRLSIFTGQSVEEVSRYFNFCPITPGEHFHYYSLDILAHYTVHSIPTIGAEFTFKSLDMVKKIRVMGDQNSLANISKMLEEGVISEKRYLEQLALFNKPTDLLIGDVGQGVIHGDPKDYENSLAKKIVFMHQDYLPDEYICQYSLAKPGYSFELVQSSYHNELLIAGKVLTSNFQVDQFDWMDALIGSCSLQTFNPGEVVLRQNETSDSVFLVLQGQLDFYIQVKGVARPKKVAYAHAGDLFGEMSVVTGSERRNASVVARNSVHLAEIDGKIFYDFIEHQNLKDTLVKIWQKRAVLQGTKIFGGLALSTINRVAQNASELQFSPNQVIIDQENKIRTLYLIKEGEVLVTYQNNRLPDELLHRSDCFGYGGSCFKTTEDATITTKSETTVLMLSWEQLKEIAKDVPLLLYRLKLSFSLLKEKEN